MKKIILAALALLALVSCDDTTDTLGSSLTGNMDNLHISTDTFTITSRSIIADSVLSRATTGYLGKIKDPETGAYITGDFTVQFHTLENIKYPLKDSIRSRDAYGNIVCDSAIIQLFFNSFYGDSLATMKLVAEEMDKPLEEGRAYYSNYNPETEGLIRQNGLKAEKIYTLTDYNIRDSLRKLTSYTPKIRIPLNQPYTDKDGITYNNYGTYVMRKYYDHPEYFRNAYSLIHNVIPGFHFKMKEGLGSMAYIFNSQLNIYFNCRETVTKNSVKKDTTVVSLFSFSGTEEVLQKTQITNDRGAISRLAADNTCTYLKTPAGIFTELTLPVEEIIKGHENDTINAARVVITRINNEQHSDYSLDIPTTLLMVERDSMYSFFEKNKVIDNKRSYYKTLDTSTSSVKKNTYTFSNISYLIHMMAEAKKNGLKNNSNWLAEHPNWNKVVLIPITITTDGSSSQNVVKVIHDMKLTSTKLVGGDNNPNGDIKVSIIYSKFSD